MRHINVQVTMTWLDFNFWEGAKDTVSILIDFDLINTVWDRLAERIEDKYEEVSETDINDFFWFETDYIAQDLGYKDWEALLAHLYGYEEEESEEAEA